MFARDDCNMYANGSLQWEKHSSAAEDYDLGLLSRFVAKYLKICIVDAPDQQMDTTVCIVSFQSVNANKLNQVFLFVAVKIL